MTGFAETVLADLSRSTRLQVFLAARGWKADFTHLVESQPTPQSPSAATSSPAAEGEKPGPAALDGIPDGPVAAPGGAQDAPAPETSAPGAPPDETEPATPPAGEGLSAEAPGAEHLPDEVTPEEVEAEFGPAPEAVSEDVVTEVREGLDAAERGETVDLGSFAKYADGTESEPGQ